MELKRYKYTGKLLLEGGRYLDRPEIAYTTHGELNADHSNVVWVLHALTGSSDPTTWWSDIVGPGKAIDTDRYFVVCASSLGGAYGSTHPHSVDPASGKPYYHDFPVLTNRDIAHGFDLLRQHLGLRTIKLVVGSSLGGQQALEWMIEWPTVFERALLIATNAVHSPWGKAFNAAQRMAIEADTTWLQPSADAGKAGLAAARAIAMLSYRTAKGYNRTQADDSGKLTNYRASTYQRYQGSKLADRYDALSYYRLTQAMDSHDVARDRGSVESALSRITARTSIVGIDSDLLFPIDEQRLLHASIDGSILHEISSDFGHDGFLTEAQEMQRIIALVLSADDQVGLVA